MHRAPDFTTYLKSIDGQEVRLSVFNEPKRKRYSVVVIQTFYTLDCDREPPCCCGCWALRQQTNNIYRDTAKSQ
jgi:hypothetical protein